MSTAGGLGPCLDRVMTLGVDAVQIFASSPRQWSTSRHPPADVAAFGDALRDLGLPLFVHTIYLVNLASPDGALRERSAGALAHALAFSAMSGAAGVVTHVGSHRGAGFEAGAQRVAEAVHRAVEQVRAEQEGARPSPRLLLETSAGGGDTLGRSPAEVGRLARALEPIGVPVGVCLDTAHLFAAGYPIHTGPGVGAALGEVGAEIGLVHLNDSRSGLGSLADRHENLWEGQIGHDGLAGWLTHPELRDVPFVLEVPGFDGRGPDRRNLWRARRLRLPDAGVTP